MSHTAVGSVRGQAHFPSLTERVAEMQSHSASVGALSHTVPTSEAEKLLNEQCRLCTTKTNNFTDCAYAVRLCTCGDSRTSQGLGLRIYGPGVI